MNQLNKEANSIGKAVAAKKKAKEDASTEIQRANELKAEKEAAKKAVQLALEARDNLLFSLGT